MGACHELCRRNENAPEHDLDDIDEGAQSDTASSEDGGYLKPSNLEKHIVRMDVDDWDSDFGDSAADALPTKPFAEQTVADLSRVLCRSLSYHTPIPHALGTQAASLPHKTSCLTSTMSILALVAQHLDNIFKSGVSGTMDLGTEYGISDVAQAGWWTHFSAHMQPSAIQPDDDANHADFDSGEPEERDYLFKSMLSVAVVLHIIDNCAKRLHTGLTEWLVFASFFAMLQICSPRKALDRPLCTVVFEMVASIITWCILTDILTVWLNTGGNL